MALRLRAARDADAAAIVALHLASWCDTYRGVLDDAFLDGPAEAAMEAHWQASLADRALPGIVALASIAGEPVGFAAALQHGTNAHMDNLHVRPGLRGAGIGRALVGFVAERMGARGCASADLEVFAANAGALRFYRSLGALIGPEEAGETFGQRVPVRRCEWADIAKLVAAAQAPKAR